MSIKLMGVEGDMLWQDEPNAKTMDLIMMGAQKFQRQTFHSFMTWRWRSTTVASINCGSL